MNDNAKEHLLGCKHAMADLSRKLGQLRTEAEEIMIAYHQALGMTADSAFAVVNELPERVAKLNAELVKLGGGAAADAPAPARAARDVALELFAQEVQQTLTDLASRAAGALR
jgi:hypothetical protein